MSELLHTKSVAKPIVMNDFQMQWRLVRENVLEAVDRVGNSGWLILGDEVKQFEALLADYTGLRYAVGCASGLDALEIALRCTGLQPGEKVLTTPLSAFATTLAIIRAGGIPVFVDVDDSGLIDLQLCRNILKQYSDIRYFIPVHLYGHALSLQLLSQLKAEYNLYIIEDCAQAIGAKSAGKKVGTVGDVAATSFYPTKNLSCMGDGGALLTQNENIFVQAKSLRDYGQTAKYEHSYIGMNSRLDELQAAILRTALLPRLSNFTARRQKIAARYKQEIQHEFIKIPAPPLESDSVWHLFPMLVTQHRHKLQQHLASVNIQSAVHYPTIIPEQPVFSMNNLKFMNVSDLTKAKYFAEHELSLPIHPYLTDDEVERVITACNSWRAS